MKTYNKNENSKMFELSTKIQTYQSNAIGSCYISLFSKKKEKKEKNCSINNIEM